MIITLRNVERSLPAFVYGDPKPTKKMESRRDEAIENISPASACWRGDEKRTNLCLLCYESGYDAAVATVTDAIAGMDEEDNIADLLKKLKGEQCQTTTK